MQALPINMLVITLHIYMCVCTANRVRGQSQRVSHTEGCQAAAIAAGIVWQHYSCCARFLLRMAPAASVSGLTILACGTSWLTGWRRLCGPHPALALTLW